MNSQLKPKFENFESLGKPCGTDNTAVQITIKTVDETTCIPYHK